MSEIVVNKQLSRIMKLIFISTVEQALVRYACLKNSSIYTIGNLIPAMAGFLLLPVYSRYLSPAEYGVIASMEVVAYLYEVFVNLNLERAAYRFYFDKKDPQWRNNLFFTIHYASIIFAVFWLVIVLFFQDFIILAFPSIPFWPFFYVGIWASGC